MRHQARWLSRLSLAVMLLSTTAGLALPQTPQVSADSPALEAPASLTIGPELATGGVTIRGRHARQQLFVTGVYPGGQLRDLTHSTTYTAAPPDVVSVDASGLITPLQDGEATVRAIGTGTVAAEIRVRVEGFTDEHPINFKNQIVPIFTKLGCSGGGCHGKASGQNGFRLSLLGFYPDDDYEFLVKESRGRRLFPASPG